MSYLFLIGAAIFVLCWFIGWLRIDFAIEGLSKADREVLLAAAKKEDVAFRFTYILTFIVVFGIFELFPTIPINFKFASSMAFFIFIVSVGYNSLVRIRQLLLPSALFYSVLLGFFAIVSGYVALVFLIRDSLAVRIWY